MLKEGQTILLPISITPNNLRKIITILLLLPFICCFNSYGYYFKQYTTSNGLISNKVYHSLRDSKGYMWFFTDKGVSKFDGATFRNFSVFDGLSDNDIYSGFEDKSGRLWLFTNNGFPCYLKNDTAYNEKNNRLLKKLPKIRYIEYIYEDKDSSLYFSYYDGSVYKLTDSICIRLLDFNAADPIGCLDKRDDTLKVYGEYTTTYLLHDHLIQNRKTEWTTYFNSLKELIEITEYGVKIIKNNSLFWSYTGSDINLSSVIHIYYDENDHLFCTTNSGLIIINIKSRQKDKIFEHDEVTCTSQDIYGNYWITTKNNGIYYLNKNLDNIKNLIEIYDYKTTETRDHQLFFSKNNSIYYLPENDSTLVHLNIKFNTNCTPLFINDRYFCYTQTKNKTYCLDRLTNKTFNTLSFRNLYALSDNKFLETRWGAYLIGDLHDNFKTSQSYPIINYGGFNLFNNDTLYYYNNNKIYANNIYANNYIIIDTLKPEQSIVNLFYYNNKLFFITNDQEIITYDTRAGYKKQSFNGLPFVCYSISILNSKNKNFLLNTNKGYYIADDIGHLPEGLQKLTYPVKQSDLLNLCSSGTNVICNLNGSYYIFNDSLINKEKEYPVFYIENIAINGKRSDQKNIIVKNSFRTHVAIRLSSLKFNNVPNNYEYRIINNNNVSQWYNSASDNIDILLDKYDDYQIELRVISDNAIYSDSRFINLTILPPFYLDYRFYLVIISIIVALVYFLIRRHNKHREQIFQNELNYLQLENKAINSLLNPHFIFNAINNIQNLINLDSREIANNYLAILSKLIRQNIENLQYSFIPVAKELNLVKNYIHLQNLRFGNKIELIIDNTLSNSAQINIPPLLIHTFVENSIVHGFRKERLDFRIIVELHLSTDDYLLIKIRDNGVGLSKKEPKNNEAIPDKLSLGIEFIRKRLTRLSEFYNVTFTLEINNIAGENTGTEVMVILYSRFRNEDPSAIN